MADTFDNYVRLKNQCARTKDCSWCPFNDIRRMYSCDNYIETYSNEAREIINNWAKANPTKTYLTDFLEKFPDCKLNDGVPEDICAATLGYCQSCDGDFDKSCEECWNTEMK